MRPNDMPRPFAPDHSDGDDLVERLVSAGNDQMSGLPLLKLTVEAANEIERLRAEVALFKSELERANARCAEEHGLRELAERELAALRERIEKAPVRDTYVERVSDDESIVWLRDDAMPAEYKGHRVRLVREEDT